MGVFNPCRDRDRSDRDEGGLDGARGGRGDDARAADPPALLGEGAGKTADSAGLNLVRIDVGIVRRNATGLEDGVEGRVGGTMLSKP